MVDQEVQFFDKTLLLNFYVRASENSRHSFMNILSFEYFRENFDIPIRI
jgi:hypothetical protein